MKKRKSSSLTSPSLLQNVCVILQQQILQHSALRHQPEQIEIAAEKDVQPHLNVVAVLVLEGCHLSPDPRPALVYIDLMTLFQELHSRGKPGQSRSNDGHLQLWTVGARRRRGVREQRLERHVLESDTLYTIHIRRGGRLRRVRAKNAMRFSREGHVANRATCGGADRRCHLGVQH